MRDSDFVARYGDDEFVVVMPQTSLAGARVFANRVRSRVSEELSASVCCGLTEVQTGDDARALAGPCRFGPLQREGGRHQPAVRPRRRPHPRRRVLAQRLSRSTQRRSQISSRFSAVPDQPANDCLIRTQL